MDSWRATTALALPRAAEIQLIELPCTNGILRQAVPHGSSADSGEVLETRGGLVSTAENSTACPAQN